MNEVDKVIKSIAKSGDLDRYIGAQRDIEDILNEVRQSLTSVASRWARITGVTIDVKVSVVEPLTHINVDFVLSDSR
jgi:hypothetical protein